VEELSQASRIDRVLISPEWSEMFKAIKQHTMPMVFSDHKPIILEIGDRVASPLYFKFENMWLQSDGFIDVLKERLVELLYSYGHPSFYVHTKAKEPEGHCYESYTKIKLVSKQRITKQPTSYSLWPCKP